jgi:hypothetical protein
MRRSNKRASPREAVAHASAAETLRTLAVGFRGSARPHVWSSTDGGCTRRRRWSSASALRSPTVSAGASASTYGRQSICLTGGPSVTPTARLRSTLVVDTRAQSAQLDAAASGLLSEGHGAAGQAATKQWASRWGADPLPPIDTAKSAPNTASAPRVRDDGAELRGARARLPSAATRPPHVSSQRVGRQDAPHARALGRLSRRKRPGLAARSRERRRRRGRVPSRRTAQKPSGACGRRCRPATRRRRGAPRHVADHEARR